MILNRAVIRISFPYHTALTFILFCYFTYLIKPDMKLRICLFYIDDIKDFPKSGRKKLPHEVFLAYALA